VPQEPFRAGQTVVIQPNVVTRDGKAGVQTGEMVLITDKGIERLHAVPRGFVAVFSGKTSKGPPPPGNGGVAWSKEGEESPPTAPSSSLRSAIATDRRDWWRCGCRPQSSSM